MWRAFCNAAGSVLGKRLGGEQVVKILKKGSAMRVIFFYPGEEGTYVDNADVTLYENGIVHIRSNQEETTTHLQNCEILWNFEVDAEDRANKVRLLKPKTEARNLDEAAVETQGEGKGTKSSPSKSPDAT
jgi:hypothetical protein